MKLQGSSERWEQCGGDVRTEAETGVVCFEGQGRTPRQGPLDAGKARKRVISGTLEGASRAGTLTWPSKTDFMLLAPRIARESSACFKPLSLQ